ncbi:MAG: Wadjet anti-phage system protein JetD domain-containing protein [Burkholderiales bacterium]
MIEPEEIRARARKLWETGRVLRSIVTGEPLFPFVIPFRKPSASAWLSQFAALREWTARLEAAGKAERGTGYSLTVLPSAHAKLGTIRKPERVEYLALQDLVEDIGERITLDRFRRIDAWLRVSEPRLMSWLAAHPLVALEREASLDQMLAVTRFLERTSRPMRFARELGIAGVDSKFIETHRGVLRDWLDQLLPVTHIDAKVIGFAESGFERRYGLRYDEPLIRIRWLDAARAWDGAIVDAAIPLSDLARYGPACDHVVITENKVSFLTLPALASGLAIFGAGYAIERLEAVHWLRERAIRYWGDIDTHGFAILSRLRTFLPNVRSLLMDRDTLLAHQSLWTEEPIEARTVIDLAGLDAAESALYNDLRRDRLGVRIRLEQERIAFGAVNSAVAGLLRASTIATSLA